MGSLRKIIITRLLWLAALMVALALPVSSYLQVLTLRRQAHENAQAIFHQVSQVLHENTRELEAVTEEYRQTCLLNAEAIAYMIQHHPEILGDQEEFCRIAEMLEVDEIHIFDKTGEIFTGTHPQYYGYSFDDGEQIGFFKPLLEDKSLKLCQDVMPNTADGVIVQYSALWSTNEEFIVQVGMYPSTILEYTEKNELSYIFSLLQGSVGVELYAIDAESGTVLGSTSSNDNGKNMEDLGLRSASVSEYKGGRNATVNGVDCYCVFTDLDGTLLGYVISTDALYSSVALYVTLLGGFLCLIVFVIVGLMWLFTRRYIVNGIQLVNNSLSAVTGGNLDERVNVQSSQEFSELSAHINDMIHSLLASTDKMSFVLDHTNMRIGVYEYSTQMKTVRFTEHIPEILHWDARTQVRLSSDHRLLQQYLEQIQQTPVPGEKNTFRLAGKQEAYVKLEEVKNGADTLGIIIDVTDIIQTRKQIETERDMDLLTGLYNRRALERQLSAIFQLEMGHGALLMIDADSLKVINDDYGHTVGDYYLKEIAAVIASVGTAQHVAARMGGDEFILLLYGYDSEAAVLQDLDELRYVQHNTRLSLEDGRQIPVEFSFGYVLTVGRTDFNTMLAEADEHMYNVKRIRKRAAGKQ